MFKTILKLNDFILNLPRSIYLGSAGNLSKFLVQYKVHSVNTGLQWKKLFFSSQWKASKRVSFTINNGGTRTLVDSDILNKKRCYLTSPKVCFDWKQDSLFNMIYFLLEKVIRWLQDVETGDSRIEEWCQCGKVIIFMIGMHEI